SERFVRHRAQLAAEFSRGVGLALPAPYVCPTRALTSVSHGSTTRGQVRRRRVNEAVALEKGATASLWTREDEPDDSSPLDGSFLRSWLCLLLHRAVPRLCATRRRLGGWGHLLHRLDPLHPGRCTPELAWVERTPLSRRTRGLVV